MIPPDHPANATDKLRLQNSKLLALRDRLQRQLEDSRMRNVDLEIELESRRKKIKAMQASFSWRSTAIFRTLRRLFVKAAAASSSGNVPSPSASTAAFTLLSGLDQPIQSSYPPGRYSFSGWCLAEDDRDLFSIRARLTHSSFEATYGLKRMDVAKRFPAISTAELSGWEIEINFQPGEKEISLEVCDARGQWISFFHGPLQVGLVFEAANYSKPASPRY